MTERNTNRPHFPDHHAGNGNILQIFDSLIRSRATLLSALGALAISGCISTTPPDTRTGVVPEEDISIITASETAVAPMLVAGPGGELDSLWVDQNIIYRKRSTDGGLTFGPETALLNLNPLGNVTSGRNQPRPVSAVTDNGGETHLIMQVSKAGPTSGALLPSDIYYAPLNRYATPIDKVFVSGGLDGIGQQVDTTSVYDPRPHQWEPLSFARLGSGLGCPLPAGGTGPADTPPPIARSHHGMAATGNGLIYVAGGEENGAGPGEVVVLDTVTYFDPARGTWYEEAPMLTPRTGHALVSDGTYVYAIGGHNAVSALDSIERLNPAGGISYQQPVDGEITCTAPPASPWATQFDTLSSNRTHVAAVGVPRASGAFEIYVIGGENNGIPTNAVDAFRVLGGGSLTLLPPVPPLPVPLSRHQAVAVGEVIYVLGGTLDGNTPTDRIYTFDLNNPAAGWFWLSESLPTPRWGHSAVLANGEIVILNGSSGAYGADPLLQIDIFDPATGLWRTEPESPSPPPLSGSAVVAVTGTSLPMNLSRQGETASQARIAWSPVSDELYVVWRNERETQTGPTEQATVVSDVYLTRSADNGNSFSNTPVRLSALSVLATRENNHSNTPSVAVDTLGNAHLAWIETGDPGEFGSAPQELIYTECNPDGTSPNGIRCDTPLMIFPAGDDCGREVWYGQMGSPDVAVDEAGTVYVAWLDVAGIVYYATGSANYSPAINVCFTRKFAGGSFPLAVPIATPPAQRDDVFTEFIPAGDPQTVIYDMSVKTNKPTLVTSGIGEISVIWTNESEIRIRRSTTSGDTFFLEGGLAGGLASATERFDPHLIYDPATGRMVAQWHQLQGTQVDGETVLDIEVQARSMTLQH